jgi:hypothetical protein
MGMGKTLVAVALVALAIIAAMLLYGKYGKKKTEVKASSVPPPPSKAVEPVEPQAAVETMASGPATGSFDFFTERTVVL